MMEFQIKPSSKKCVVLACMEKIVPLLLDGLFPLYINTPDRHFFWGKTSQLFMGEESPPHSPQTSMSCNFQRTPGPAFLKLFGFLMYFPTADGSGIRRSRVEGTVVEIPPKKIQRFIYPRWLFSVGFLNHQQYVLVSNFKSSICNVELQ